MPLSRWRVLLQIVLSSISSSRLDGQIMTLAEMVDRLKKRGVAIKVPALWHQLNKWGLSYKKTLHASEQEREDVQLARKAWIDNQSKLTLSRLVFLDETGASTNMTRRFGQAVKGKRCIAAVPHGHWETTTFIAGLRHDKITAPMVLDGPMTGDAFRIYIKDFLCPTLKPGDVVIADNLRSHKISGIRSAIETVGARLVYLPPYSPDLNSIEKCFSKLKALLRKMAARMTEALWKSIGETLNSLTATECLNYFTSCGYVNA